MYQRCHRPTRKRRDKRRRPCPSASVLISYRALFDIVPALLESREFRETHPHLNTYEKVREVVLTGVPLTYEHLERFVHQQQQFEGRFPILPGALECIDTLKNKVRVKCLLPSKEVIDLVFRKTSWLFQEGEVTVPSRNQEGFFIAGTLDECPKALNARNKVFLLCHGVSSNLPLDVSQYTKVISCRAYSEITEYITASFYECERELTYALVANTRNLPKYHLHKRLRGWSMLYYPSRVHYLRQEVEKLNARWRVGVLDRLCDEDLSLTDKVMLMKVMMEKHPKDHHTFLPPTRLFEEVTVVEPGQVLIVKPSSAQRGEGISLVTTTEQLQIAKLKALELSNSSGGIVSQYVRKPFLIDGYKFHLRAYLLVTSRNETFLFEKCFIISASDPYVDNDYENTSIHDTHFKSSRYESPMVFPDDLRKTTTTSEKDIEKMKEGVEKIFERVRVCLRKEEDEEWKLPENVETAAYQILGPDVLFDAELNPWLLEVNLRPSYCPYHGLEEVETFFKEFFEWEYEKAIKPLVEEHVKRGREK